MAHPRAKLTPFGRWLFVDRVERLRWPVSQAARALGISRPTAYKWLTRWRLEGTAGLTDRSSQPHRSPAQLPPGTVARILRLRQRLKVGPRRLAPLIGLHHSTISAVLRRHGLSRLRDGDRATGVPIRYVRDHPGELIHLDTKLLGRIPAGGGHRTARPCHGPALARDTRCSMWRSMTPRAWPSSSCSPMTAAPRRPSSCSRPRPFLPNMGSASNAS